MIAELKNVDVYFGATAVLENINFKIEDRDRIGLIGVNGAGKSTLLNIITKELDATNGEVIHAKKTIGYLKQNSDFVSELSVGEVLRNVFSELLKLEKELNELYEKISVCAQDSEEYKALHSRYAQLQTRFEQQDGYNINVKIDTVRTGMGFSQIDCDRRVSSLSGGEKTRLALASLLLSEPQLLILDEPTNHLDFKTLQWLEDYLVSYKGAILMVSHDRYFLDKCVNEIAEVFKGTLKRYKGNYSEFVVTKATNLATMEKEYEKQQNEIAALKDYIARNGVRASTAKSAKSRQNTLDKMEILEKPSDYTKTIKLKFDYKTEPVKDILDVKNLSLKIGGNTLFENINLHIMRGEKIAIVGENGIGKSTFLKAILGLCEQQSGEIKWGGNVKKSYFEQETSLLDGKKSVIEEIHDRYPLMYEQQIRDILGKVLIRNEEIYKSTEVLSGGEKAKVKFTLMMLEKGNVLVLDEPTNHLDLSAKEVLDDALKDFSGTVIMVSHDRYLLNKVPTKIMEMKKNEITFYDGNYDYYVEKKKIYDLDRQLQKKEQKQETENKNKFYRSKEERARNAKRLSELKNTEKKIEETELLIQKTEEEIANPENSSDFTLLNEKCEYLEKLKTELDELYENWEALSSDE